MCTIASLRLLTSDWHQPHTAETTLWLDIGKGLFLGSVVYLIQQSISGTLHSTDQTQPRPGGIPGSGVGEVTEENEQVQLVGDLAQTHPLFTIEERSISETSLSSRKSLDETFPSKKSAPAKQSKPVLRSNNSHSKSAPTSLPATRPSIDSSSSSTEYISAEASSDDLSTWSGSGSQHTSPCSGQDDDALSTFCQFLNEDKQNEAQQDTGRKARAASKRRKEKRSKCAANKHGRRQRSATPTTTATFHNQLAAADESPSNVRNNAIKRKQSSEPSCPPGSALSSSLRSPSQSNQEGQGGGQQPSVRFADEDGYGIEILHGDCGSSNEESPISCKRALVLLMLPTKQVYEFVGLEYNVETDPSATEKESGGIRVSEILNQLPSMASDPNVCSAHFVCLIRWHYDVEQTSEMKVSSSIQSYRLRNDEVLVAVPQGSSPQNIMESAKGVLQNQKLMRAVSEALWKVQM